MAQAFSDANYEELVLKADKLAVVDFWAEWCGPCRAISPLIDEVATEYEGKVVIGKVDVEGCPGVTKKYGVRNIPTLLFIKGGEVVEKHVGPINKKDLVAKIEAHL